MVGLDSNGSESLAGTLGSITRTSFLSNSLLLFKHPWSPVMNARTHQSRFQGPSESEVNILYQFLTFAIPQNNL